MSMSSSQTEPIRFPTTPAPSFSPEDRPVRTAACLIIGDEILNGKTLETNSHVLASSLFARGISLRKVEIIPDDERTIVGCLKRLTKDEEGFDMIFTSGGIGPTHDDITYQSLAKVFDPDGQLEYDEETFRRMQAIQDRKPSTRSTTAEQVEARRRMTLFPAKFKEVLFVQGHLWVPVVCLKKKVYVLPGVPGLFKQLLEGLLGTYIHLPPLSDRQHRVLVQTTLPESALAPYLSKLAQEVSKEQIQLGSYPNLVTGIVSVSVIGRDQSKIEEVGKMIEEQLKKIQNTRAEDKSANL